MDRAHASSRRPLTIRLKPAICFVKKFWTHRRTLALCSPFSVPIQSAKYTPPRERKCPVSGYPGRVNPTFGHYAFAFLRRGRIRNDAFFPLLRGGVDAPIKRCNATLDSARPRRSNRCCNRRLTSLEAARCRACATRPAAPFWGSETFCLEGAAPPSKEGKEKHVLQFIQFTPFSPRIPYSSPPWSLSK